MFTQKYLKPDINLFENQKHNVKLLIHRRKALLSDRVGSGKTLSVLYSFAYLKEHEALNAMLVLTPLSAYEKETWRKDVEKFTEMKCISVDDLSQLVGNDFSRLPQILAEHPIVYGKHTHMKQLMPLLRAIVTQPKTLLCLDEVHAFKNPKSEISVRCRQLTDKIPFFWGITGTSVSKNMDDLYSIVSLISPWYLGNYLSFRDKYCIVKEQVTGRRADGKLNKVKVVVGVKDDMEGVLQQKLEPLIVRGDSFFSLKFHWLDYELSTEEKSLYRKIARGIDVRPDASNEEWLSLVLADDTLEDKKPTYIKDVDAFSSRFIFLQYCADGVLNKDGSFDRIYSTKVDMLLVQLKNIVSKGQSVIVYFDFYAPLHAVQQRLLSNPSINADVLESSGTHVLSADEVSEDRCRKKPIIILGTRASAESVSYYFINHVIFFNIPTVPTTFVQTVGRITRKNSLFPDDLNVYIFRSENIDLYKMMLVSCKTYQLEIVQGKENNVPDDYKWAKSKDTVDKMKKVLLWNTKK